MAELSADVLNKLDAIASSSQSFYELVSKKVESSEKSEAFDNKSVSQILNSLESNIVKGFSRFSEDISDSVKDGVSTVKNSIIDGMDFSLQYIEHSISKSNLHIIEELKTLNNSLNENINKLQQPITETKTEDNLFGKIKSEDGLEKFSEKVLLGFSNLTKSLGESFHVNIGFVIDELENLNSNLTANLQDVEIYAKKQYEIAEEMKPIARPKYKDKSDVEEALEKISDKVSKTNKDEDEDKDTEKKTKTYDPGDPTGILSFLTSLGMLVIGGLLGMIASKGFFKTLDNLFGTNLTESFNAIVPNFDKVLDRIVDYGKVLASMIFGLGSSIKSLVFGVVRLAYHTVSESLKSVWEMSKSAVNVFRSGKAAQAATATVEVAEKAGTVATVAEEAGTAANAAGRVGLFGKVGNFLKGSLPGRILSKANVGGMLKGVVGGLFAKLPFISGVLDIALAIKKFIDGDKVGGVIRIIKSIGSFMSSTLVGAAIGIPLTILADFLEDYTTDRAGGDPTKRSFSDILPALWDMIKDFAKWIAKMAISAFKWLTGSPDSDGPSNEVKAKMEEDRRRLKEEEARDKREAALKEKNRSKDSTAVAKFENEGDNNSPRNNESEEELDPFSRDNKLIRMAKSAFGENMVNSVLDMKDLTKAFMQEGTSNLSDIFGNASSGFQIFNNVLNEGSAPNVAKVDSSEITSAMQGFAKELIPAITQGGTHSSTSGGASMANFILTGGRDHIYSFRNEYLGTNSRLVAT